MLARPRPLAPEGIRPACHKDPGSRALIRYVGSDEPPAPGATVPDGRPAFGGASFEAFFVEAEPRLRRALVGRYGTDRGREAAAEALAWGFEHWPEVQRMDNPIGYLYRVGTSRSRPKRRVDFEAPRSGAGGRDPEIEPGLAAALGDLTANQRVAVVLLAGYGCRFEEVAQLTGRSLSTVNTHYRRGMAKLRGALGVESTVDGGAVAGLPAAADHDEVGR